MPIFALFILTMRRESNLRTSDMGHGKILAKLRLKAGVSNTRPAGRMWPAKGVCAARDSLLNRQKNHILN
jgi:hypothetical protein